MKRNQRAEELTPLTDQQIVDRNKRGEEVSRKGPRWMARRIVLLEEEQRRQDQAWLEAEKFDQQFGLWLSGDSALAALLSECEERLAREALERVPS